MKKSLSNFILKIVEMSYKFLSKFRCTCCISKCDVDKSVNKSINVEILSSCNKKLKSSKV